MKRCFFLLKKSANKLNSLPSTKTINTMEFNLNPPGKRRQNSKDFASSICFWQRTWKVDQGCLALPIKPWVTLTFVLKDGVILNRDCFTKQLIIFKHRNSKKSRACYTAKNNFWGVKFYSKDFFNTYSKTYTNVFYPNLWNLITIFETLA